MENVGEVIGIYVLGDEDEEEAIAAQNKKRIGRWLLKQATIAHCLRDIGQQ